MAPESTLKLAVHKISSFFFFIFYVIFIHSMNSYSPLLNVSLFLCPEFDFIVITNVQLFVYLLYRNIYARLGIKTLKISLNSADIKTPQIHILHWPQYFWPFSWQTGMRTGKIKLLNVKWRITITYVSIYIWVLMNLAIWQKKINVELALKDI